MLTLFLYCKLGLYCKLAKRLFLNSIPFKLKVSDFSELDGLIHFDGQNLQIEFVHGDSIVKLFKSRAKSLTLPLSRISHVEHRKGWFKDEFVVQAKTMKDCEGMPGSKGGKFVMKVKRKTRKQIESFLVDFDLALSELRLAQLEDSRDARISKRLEE